MNRKGIALGVVLSIGLAGGSALAAGVKAPASKAAPVVQEKEVLMVKISETPIAEWTKRGGKVRIGNKILAPDPDAVYSAVTTFTGSATTMSGSGIPCAIVAGNDITGAQWDDLTFNVNPAAILAPTTNTFYIYNGNASDTVVRARLRVHDTTGVGGGPGVSETGYSVAAPYLTVTAGAIAGFTFHDVGTPNFTLGASNTFWYGLQFDNAVGAIAGVTCTELLKFGVGVVSAVEVGTSTDNIFNGDTAASVYGVNNPTGVMSTLGTHGYNLAWELTVPLVPVQLMRFSAD